METTKIFKFNNQIVKFDRKAICDYCSIKKDVAVVKYHSTHYNDLICFECMKKINNYHKTAFNENILEVIKNEKKN